MKLTTMLLLAGCLQLSAAGLAQKVSVTGVNIPLKKVFREVRRQTGYSFFYNARLLENAHTVNIDAKGMELQELLDQCFRDQPLSYAIVGRTVVVRPRRDESFTPSPAPVLDTAPARIWISGRVLDESNNVPVTGANVTIKGTQTGTVSGKEGEFRIGINPGEVLVISFVGYKPMEVRPAGVAPLTVRLRTNKDPLAGMVITGYQVINKESFTGNSTTVSGEDLKKVNPQNVLQGIQIFDPSFSIAVNNLSGSNPNSLPVINVRGSTALPSGNGDVLSRTSLSSNVNLPTFILDGFEVSLEKVYDMDINRIQSITLLKDAAATAIYGSRAANGVLVITTKAPREGKLQLYYNYELNTTTPDLSDYHLLNAREKLDYEVLADLYKPVGGISQDDQDVRYYQKNKNVLSGINTYWLSQPVRTTFGHKHSLYLEGGSSSVRYGVDLRYQTAPGVMKGSTRDRYSLGMDLSYNPNKTFLFKNVLTVNQVNSRESPYGAFSDYARMNPYFPKTDTAGNIIQAPDSWLIDTHQSGSGQYVTDVALNPLYNATLHSFNKGSYLELIDAFSGEWNIAKGLRLRSLLSYTKKKTDYNIFRSPLANDFYFYPTSLLSKRGSYSYTTYDESTFDGNVTLNYNRQLGDHYFNVLLGSNVRTYSFEGKSFAAIGFTNDRFTNIGFANSFPEQSSPGGLLSKERLFGTLLGINYSLKNRYLLDINLRADGSSKFGTENKMANFWAVGLGWNAHKEDFMRRYGAISQLRFRVSTGLTGSVQFPPYLSKTTYSYYSTNWYSTGVGAGVTNYGNETLQWQRTRESDAGFDLGLFKDRLIISPRYYYKITNGLLADINLPPSSGFLSYKANLGDMANRGYELSLKYTMISNRNLTVNIFANLVRNTNKILKISNALKAYNDKADQAQQQNDSFRAAPLLRYQEGQSLNTIYAVRSLGIDPENGQEIFVKKNGSHTYTWDVKDIVPVADATPKVTGSFGTSVSYKRFQLNANFFTILGGKNYNQTLVDRVENADPRYNVDRRVLTDRWKNPGDHAFFKNIADLGTSNLSDRFVQNDNQLSLQSVYLSYDCSSLFYSRMGMKNLRLAFTMNDVFHWSSMKIERGTDYPFARSFTFSVQTSF